MAVNVDSISYRAPRQGGAPWAFIAAAVVLAAIVFLTVSPMLTKKTKSPMPNIQGPRVGAWQFGINTWVTNGGCNIQPELWQRSAGEEFTRFKVGLVVFFSGHGEKDPCSSVPGSSLVEELDEFFLGNRLNGGIRSVAGEAYKAFRAKLLAPPPVP